MFSGENWNTDKWSPLLSCCDSSQLADGAAVAIIFNNVPALKKILATGRCNTNIPTTLTGIYSYTRFFNRYKNAPAYLLGILSKGDRFIKDCS